MRNSKANATFTVVGSGIRNQSPEASDYQCLNQEFFRLSSLLCGIVDCNEPIRGCTSVEKLSARTKDIQATLLGEKSFSGCFGLGHITQVQFEVKHFA